jgi:protein involved in plasmid replication-relaxation
MTARGMAARVARLQQTLGERELAVLASLARVRLLTTDQVARLQVAEGSEATRSRRTRSLLRRLGELGLVVRLGRQVGGVRAGSSSTIFGPSGLGLAVLEVSGPYSRRRTIWQSRPYFHDHLLAVSELYVRLVEDSRGSACEMLAFAAEPACWRRFGGVGGEAVVLKPDAYVRIGVGDYELAWFAEVDLGTESLPTIRRKCQVYLRYWRAGMEQQRSGVFPRVAWLVPDDRRLDGVTQVLQRFAAEAAGLFTVALHTAAPSLLTSLPTSSGGAS